MKVLDRYLVREMLAPFLIGTVAVVLMFQANMIIALFKNLEMSNVPLLTVAQIIFFKTPEFLVLTLPIGTALAASLAVSRITRESELTAMRAAGISIRRVILPVAVAGLLVAGLNFLVVEQVRPSAERQARRLSNEVGFLSLAPEFKSNVVVQLRNFTATFGSIRRGEAGVVMLQDLLLIERRPGGEAVLVTAPSGEYRNGVWRIQSPLVRVLKGLDLMSFRTERELRINEPISVPSLFADPAPEELSIRELRKAIADGRRFKHPTADLEVAYWTKFSVPAACFVFAVTGAMFAVWFSARGAYAGVLLSLALVLAYYNLYVVSTQIFGRNGWLPPFWAAWLPDLICLSIGIYALRRLE